ncbi:hypothetical protein Desgi_0930 [Desulfoscipio gibsoniae DSM 7213]|uniref:Uncharacterized protein n=1 Tax=Desulfoscipio gibsoniae DSM 7213 TaxID=767817 RepID=R4KLF7_9FIRM|nr:hypothetical protein Desgi_0930 [Desulfoscipio gibsoniae DSM 7213]
MAKGKKCEQMQVKKNRRDSCPVMDMYTMVEPNINIRNIKH